MSISLVFSLYLVACSTAEKAIKAKAKTESADLRYYSERLGVDLDHRSNLKLAAAVVDWLGVPHHQGGQSKKGTDCSGFANYIYRTVYGVEIPRSSSEIYERCQPKRKEQLQEGDFVFFKVGSRHINHVGIYLKDGKFAHASTSRGVIVSSLDEPYWQKYWFSGGRLRN
ncbi:MAG: NlpC/P60 family protein [Flavobacteriales bacterium]|nr:NlpC/P60 family protein [Flavobacteriales bacterium]MCX7768329.1 NlpC/P60 family protein [Flavobacteriales bacterium]MDW8409111.1 NlpC/P60 family protein [Flavobacteriales bacterium]